MSIASIRIPTRIRARTRTTTVLAAAALLLVLVQVSELLDVVGATHTLELELVHTLDELAEVEAAAAALLLLITAQSERLRRRGFGTDA